MGGGGVECLQRGEGHRVALERRGELFGGRARLGRGGARRGERPRRRGQGRQSDVLGDSGHARLVARHAGPARGGHPRRAADRPGRDEGALPHDEQLRGRQLLQPHADHVIVHGADDDARARRTPRVAPAHSGGQVALGPPPVRIRHIGVALCDARRLALHGLSEAPQLGVALRGCRQSGGGADGYGPRLVGRWRLPCSGGPRPFPLTTDPYHFPFPLSTDPNPDPPTLSA